MALQKGVIMSDYEINEFGEIIRKENENKVKKALASGEKISLADLKKKEAKTDDQALKERREKLKREKENQTNNSNLFAAMAAFKKNQENE